MFRTITDFYDCVSRTDIPKGSGSITRHLFEQLKDDLFLRPRVSYSDYIKNAFQKYEDYKSTYRATYGKKLQVNGQFFEMVFGCLLIQLDIAPFYSQVELTFIPDIRHDIVLFEKMPNPNNTGFLVKPICISLKTSARERYKQADLEAMALKNVHRNAECYLVFLNEPTYSNINRKIENKATFGFDKVFNVWNDATFDNFIINLKDRNYCNPRKVPLYMSASKITK